MLPFLIFAVVAALIVSIAIWAHRMAKKRLLALKAWAEGAGLQFSTERLYGLDSHYPDFPFLGRGKDRYAHNIARGRLGDLAVYCFDYHYVTEHRDSEGRTQRTHHNFSACIVQPDFGLKPLVIRKENLFDRIKETFGSNDIDFESAEFSKKFYVSASDRSWAYQVITARAIEYLLHAPEFEITFGNFQVALKRDARFNASEFETAIQVARTLLSFIPERLKTNSQENRN